MVPTGPPNDGPHDIVFPLGALNVYEPGPLATCQNRSAFEFSEFDVFFQTLTKPRTSGDTTSDVRELDPNMGIQNQFL